MKEAVQVVVLKCVKTKSGKSLVTYAVPTKETGYSKGAMLLDCWYDNADVFDKLTPGMQTLNGQFKYSPGFNGTARMHITDLVDANGVVLLAE